MRIGGSITQPTSTSLGQSWVRIVLVLDKQANGALATPSDVFETTAAATTDIFAFQNMDNVDRFKIIKDKKITLDPVGFGIVGTSSAICTKNFKISHKCNTEIVYSSTTGALTEVRSNNYILFISSNSNAVTFAGKSRVYWKE